MNVINYLRDSAGKFPNNKSVVYRDIVYSYAELDRMSDNIAFNLIKRGVKPTDNAGIYFFNNDMTLPAVYGIIKAGGAYTPLNTDFPKARLDFIKQDGKIEVVLDNVNVREFAFSETEPVPLPELQDDNPYCLVYTSGSTGKPKGVILTHKNPIVYAEYYTGLIGLNENDAVTMYANLPFALHMADIFPAVKAGACVHIIDGSIKLDVRAIAEYLKDNRIVSSVFPTAVGHEIIGRDCGESMRALLMGGEKFIPFTKKGGKFDVYNVYGATECAALTFMHKTDCSDADKITEIPVGKPITGVSYRILDEEMKPVAKGETGNLYVSGNCVGGGYRNLPSQKNFVKVNGTVLYKTGDLAYVNENDDVVIQGRADFRIKLRGNRIEPSEIDRVILTCEENNERVINESVTIAQNGRLVTFYSAENICSTDGLRKHAEKFLPEYMVPFSFVRLEKLPRNPNGKIDRNALPEITIKTSEISETAFNSDENTLAEIWGNILKINSGKIKLTDNFFEIGGDSLRALLLSLEIEKVFSAEITPATVFANPELVSLAKLITLSKSGGKPYSGIHIYNSKGTNTPLFFVHSGNTGGESYRYLAEELYKIAPDKPLYVFEHYNMLSSGGNFLGIADLSERYIDKMLQITNGGKFALGGWSFGGIVAFEMALRLQKKGIAAENIFLIDPNIVTSAKEKSLNEQLTFTSHYKEYLESDKWFGNFRKAGMLERLFANNSFVLSEILRYVPGGKFTGKATLFKFTLPDANSKDDLVKQLWEITSAKEDNGFSSFTEELKIVRIADTHDKALNNIDTVKKIAEIINICT
jgi:fengycin family lipopeptide synthetase D